MSLSPSVGNERSHARRHFPAFFAQSVRLPERFRGGCSFGDRRAGGTTTLSLLGEPTIHPS